MSNTDNNESVDVWTLCGNSNAYIHKGNGLFRWITDSDMPMAPVRIVKYEDYLALQQRVEELQQQLQEARSEGDELRDVLAFLVNHNDMPDWILARPIVLAI